MKNTTELRDSLTGVFADLRNETLEVQRAKALIATSNSMLKSLQLEMEHSKMIGSKKAIKFARTP